MPQWPLDRMPTKQLSTHRTSQFTTGGTAHTKGGFEYIGGFVNTTITGIVLNVGGNGGSAVNGTDTSTLMDLAIEVPGQGDRVVIADMQVGWGAARQKAIYIPFHIPSSGNSFLAVRGQSAQTSKVITYDVDILTGEGSSSLSLPQKYTTYGVNSGTSSAVTVTPGGSEVKGSWTEITASTTAPVHELMITVQGTGTLVDDNNIIIDIGIGGSGSEKTIYQNFFCSGNTDNESILYQHTQYLPIRYNIPTGQRLSVRASAVPGSPQNISVQLIGITY